MATQFLSSQLAEEMNNADFQKELELLRERPAANMTLTKSPQGPQ